MAGKPLTYWLSGAVSAVAGVIVGLAFALVIVSFIATRFGDYDFVTVRTGSMEPDISGIL